MKKFLKFYLPIFAAFLSLIFLISAYLLNNHPIFVQYMFGDARLYCQIVDAVVKINGQESPEVKVYKVENENLLVYTPFGLLYKPVVIVDKAKNDIGGANAGYENYELLFNRYLLQSENSHGITYASETKTRYDVNLEITESKVSYNVTQNDGGRVNFEILLNGE
jgi:hypothetical protein